MDAKKKFLLYFGIVVIICAAIVYFVIIPTTNDIKQISDKIYNEKVDLEKRYIKGQLIKKLVEDFKKIKPQQEKLELIFIKEGTELNLITKLENLASTNNVDLEINLENIRELNKLQSMQLQLSIDGNYLDTIAYLNDIERLNNYYNLDTIRVNTIGQKSNGYVNLLLQGDIFIDLNN